MGDKMIFKHYKGGLYKLLHIGYHSETLEEMVVYQSLKDYKVWIRPKRMFFELVDINGEKIPRFKRM